MTAAQKDRLFQLLGEHCTNTAIKRLLDRYRDDDSDIRVSGKSADLLDHLKRAYERGTLKDRDLFALLADAEENGHQHVLFYVPKNNAVKAVCNEAVAIEKALLDGKTAVEAKLPKFYIDLSGVEIADFRTGSVPDTEYSFWLFKLYAGLDRIKYLGEKDLGNNRFIREYERYQSREVLLVKWHSFGLLELRIAAYQSMSRKSFKNDVGSLWKALSSAIKQNDFISVNLNVAAGKLVADAEKRATEYICGKACFRDDQDGEVSFNPADPDESLHSSPLRSKAAKGLKDCTKLVVCWLNPRNDDRLPDKLRTEIGSYLENEIRIGAQTTSEAVNRVANRLHELSV